VSTNLLLCKSKCIEWTLENAKPNAECMFGSVNLVRNIHHINPNYIGGMKQGGFLQNLHIKANLLFCNVLHIYWFAKSHPKKWENGVNFGCFKDGNVKTIYEKHEFSPNSPTCHLTKKLAPTNLFPKSGISLVLSCSDYSRKQQWHLEFLRTLICFSIYFLTVLQYLHIHWFTKSHPKKCGN